MSLFVCLPNFSFLLTTSCDLTKLHFFGVRSITEVNHSDLSFQLPQISPRYTVYLFLLCYEKSTGEIKQTYSVIY